MIVCARSCKHNLFFIISFDAFEYHIHVVPLRFILSRLFVRKSVCNRRVRLRRRDEAKRLLFICCYWLLKWYSVSWHNTIKCGFFGPFFCSHLVSDITRCTPALHKSSIWLASEWKENACDAFVLRMKRREEGEYCLYKAVPCDSYWHWNCRSR